jgi:hypothetical protein
MLPIRLTILLAARCGGDFGTFVQNISADAEAVGISPSVTSAALGGLTQENGGARLRPAPARHVR